MALTDSSLLLQLRTTGNEECWNEFVSIYHPVIRQVVRRSGVAQSDIEDIVQEVLVQLVLAMPQFNYRKDRGLFRNWLRRVTLNKVHDRRRRAAQQACSLEVSEEIPDEGIPIETWKQELRLQLLRCALKFVRQSARAKTWKCFSGHVLEGRNAAAVAFEMGISENAVYVNSSRVLRKIRQFCAKHGEELGNADTCLPLRG